MSLTLLALFLSPLYLSLVLNPKESHKALKNIVSDGGLRLTFSMFLLLLALTVLSSTGLNLAWDWDHLLAWLGVIIAVTGTVFLLFPDMIEKKLKHFSAEQFPVFGFLGLIIALGLVYLDTQVLL
jgi:Flp pilus assembly protein TadB